MLFLSRTFMTLYTMLKSLEFIDTFSHRVSSTFKIQNRMQNINYNFFFQNKVKAMSIWICTQLASLSLHLNNILCIEIQDDVFVFCCLYTSHIPRCETRDRDREKWEKIQIQPWIEWNRVWDDLADNDTVACRHKGVRVYHFGKDFWIFVSQFTQRWHMWLRKVKRACFWIKFRWLPLPLNDVEMLNNNVTRYDLLNFFYGSFLRAHSFIKNSQTRNNWKIYTFLRDSNIEWKVKSRSFQNFCDSWENEITTLSYMARKSESIDDYF